jgi:hypothetical protein
MAVTTINPVVARMMFMTELHGLLALYICSRVPRRAVDRRDQRAPKIIKTAPKMVSFASTFVL